MSRSVTLDRQGNSYTVGGLIRFHAAVLSLAASAIHFAVLGAHFEEWWGYGVFFALVAWYQAAWALLIAVRPGRAAYWLGAVPNAAVVFLWAITRVSGIPLGPSSGIVEDVAPPDSIATAFEIIIVALCVALATRRRAVSVSPVLFWGAATTLAFLIMTLGAVAIADWGTGVDHHADGSSVPVHNHF